MSTWLRNWQGYSKTKKTVESDEQEQTVLCGTFYGCEIESSVQTMATFGFSIDKTREAQQGDR